MQHKFALKKKCRFNWCTPQEMITRIIFKDFKQKFQKLWENAEMFKNVWINAGIVLSRVLVNSFCLSSIRRTQSLEQIKFHILKAIFVSMSIIGSTGWWTFHIKLNTWYALWAVVISHNNKITLSCHISIVTKKFASNSDHYMLYSLQ